MMLNGYSLNITPMNTILPSTMKTGEKDSVRPTGILELDRMLHGGLPRNAAILLAGPPGAGKTILALQWLYAGYRDFKESAIYFTLTEPTTKLIKNLGKMTFNDPEFMASADAHISNFDNELIKRPGVHFVDLRIVIKDLGIEENDFSVADIRKLCEAILGMVAKTEAKRVVIDSITALAYRLLTEDKVRTLIFELGTYLGGIDANVVMTAEAADEDSMTARVEEFIADGVIRLSYGRNRQNLTRVLEIVKMRGLDFDSRLTEFRISRDGLVLFPRLRQELQYQASLKRVTSGVAGLDEMLHGGYFEGSSILLSGATGSGKTLIALRGVLGGLAAGEKALFVSFEESRDHLIKSVQSFGWDLEKYEKAGQLLIIASYPEEHSFDEHLSLIRHAIDTFGPSRVVIDSITALANAVSEEEVRDFTSQMIAYVKSKNITCLLTAATANLTGASESISGVHLSTITDTIVLLRFVEIQSELRRAMLILKVRGSDHDKGLREYVITPAGVEVTTKFSGYEGLLAGATRKVSQSSEEQLHALFMATFGPMGEKIFLEQKAKGITLANVQGLIAELGDQGILSTRRKEEFLGQASEIIGDQS
jgi:circadian clock protein KaiC